MQLLKPNLSAPVKAKDQLKVLEALGGMIGTMLRKIIFQPLPHEMVFLLSILEAKERERTSSRASAERLVQMTKIPQNT